jgi:hypothetical protein
MCTFGNDRLESCPTSTWPRTTGETRAGFLEDLGQTWRSALTKSPRSDRFSTKRAEATFKCSYHESGREIGFAEDLEAFGAEVRASELDVIDVQCHGGSAVRMYDQGISVMDVDLGLKQAHAHFRE